MCVQYYAAGNAIREVNLSIKFTSNGKREFVPGDQVSSLFVDY